LGAMVTGTAMVMATEAETGRTMINGARNKEAWKTEDMIEHPDGKGNGDGRGTNKTQTTENVYV